MEIIHGPLAAHAVGGVIYQVTLASGIIATNPSAFGPIEPNSIPQETVVTEDGRVLVYPMKVVDDQSPAAVKG